MTGLQIDIADVEGSLQNGGVGDGVEAESLDTPSDSFRVGNFFDDEASRVRAADKDHRARIVEFIIVIEHQKLGEMLRQGGPVVTAKLSFLET